MNITFGEATEADINIPGKWDKVVSDFLELTEPNGEPVKFRVILAEGVPAKTIGNGLQGVLRRAKAAGAPLPVRVVQRREKIYLARTEPGEETESRTVHRRPTDETWNKPNA